MPEEPGWLQFMESQRVRHDWAANTHTDPNTQKNKVFLLGCQECKDHVNKKKTVYLDINSELYHEMFNILQNNIINSNTFHNVWVTFLHT